MVLRGTSTPYAEAVLDQLLVGNQAHVPVLWHEMCRLAAAESWRRGEAEHARVIVKAGRMTMRQFLRERFGIVTGAREYWHQENWTADRAELQEFLGALRNARRVA